MSDLPQEADRKEVAIRSFGGNDSPEELTSLLNSAYVDLKSSGLAYAAAKQDAAATLKRIKDQECIIAIIDGTIVGTILYVNRSKQSGLLWYDHPRVSAFSQLAVHPGWQSRGIARKLLDYVEKKARNEGAQEIAADTAVHAKRLLEMYKARGYQIVDYTYWPNTNYCSAVFSKRLCADSRVEFSPVRRIASRWRARLRQLKWRLKSR